MRVDVPDISYAESDFGEYLSYCAHLMTISSTDSFHWQVILEKQKPQPRYVITLIHGTFASRAPWVLNRNSHLRTYLRKNLPGQVTFRSNVWSGHNRSTDRINGASRLEGHLLRRIQLYPDAKHFVIGHSHGGNVAMYAMRNSQVAQGISGTIGLNTPWISATHRNTGQLLFLMAIIGLLTLEFILIGAATRLAGSSRFLQIVSGLISGLSLVGLIFIAVYQGEKVAQWMRERREQLIRTLELPYIEHPPVFCLWGAGDEVRNVFTVLEAMVNIPFLLLHWISLALNGIGLFILHRLGKIPLAYTMPLQQMPSLFERWMQSVFIDFVSTLVYLSEGIACVLAATLLLNTVLRLFPIGIAVTRFIDSIFVHLSFSLKPVPSTNTDFCEIEFPISFFSHSEIYQDEDALAALCRWIIKSSQYHQTALNSSHSSP